MAYQIEWLLENHIVFVKIEGVSTVADFQEINEKTLVLLKASPAERVHCILDSTFSREEPTLMEQARIFTVIESDRLGWLLDITQANRTIRFINMTLMHLKRVRYRHLASMEVALAFLKDHAPSLPPFEIDDLRVHIQRDDLVSEQRT